MAKKHRADKGFLKVCSLNKFQFRWTVNRFESPTFLCRDVVWHFIRRHIGTSNYRPTIRTDTSGPVFDDKQNCGDQRPDKQTGRTPKNHMSKKKK